MKNEEANHPERLRVMREKCVVCCVLCFVCCPTGDSLEKVAGVTKYSPEQY